MKYAAIAALIAVVSAAAEDNGCKKGMKTTFYTDKKCTTVDADTEAVEFTKDQMKASAFDGKCNKANGSSTKVKCTSEGIETSVYKDVEDCSGEGVAVAVKWTNCYSSGTGDDKKYFQLTGAAALKAAAIALVAIAGSQF